MSTAQKSKSKGTQTILWWVGWITLTIASFFVAAAFWTPVIAHHLGSVREAKPAILWVAAVFGTWMIFLVPLIIFMYQKVDKAYEDARIRREKNALHFRSILVPAERRRIPEKISQKLVQVPETIDGGHLVDLTLRSGEKIPNVFVSDRREILGVYDARELTFDAADVTGLELVDMSKPPVFLTANWLRLDGATVPE